MCQHCPVTAKGQLRVRTKSMTSIGLARALHHHTIRWRWGFHPIGLEGYVCHGCLSASPAKWSRVSIAIKLCEPMPNRSQLLDTTQPSLLEAQRRRAAAHVSALSRWMGYYQWLGALSIAGQGLKQAMSYR